MFWHWERYHLGRKHNRKFKPYNGKTDKPGKSQLDLKNIEELVKKLKEDSIAGTIEKEDWFAKDHFPNSVETWQSTH